MFLAIFVFCHFFNYNFAGFQYLLIKNTQDLTFLKLKLGDFVLLVYGLILLSAEHFIVNISQALNS